MTSNPRYQISIAYLRMQSASGIEKLVEEHSEIEITAFAPIGLRIKPRVIAVLINPDLLKAGDTE